MITFADMTKEEEILVQEIGDGAIPRHIAIIMDGNGRYAQKLGKERVWGHIVGVESVRRAIISCEEIGVEVLTLYTFSAENWSRSEKEVAGLMHLIEAQFTAETEELHKKNIKIKHIGRMEKLPESLQNVLNNAMELTKNNTGLTIQFAINYSGRNEIIDAAKKIAEMVKSGKINIDDIDEELVSLNMYNPKVVDPDLIIRTAGELRVSNYLLWEIAYSEIWVTDTLWPEFTRETLLTAIANYIKRTRKFGNVTE